MYYLQPQSDCLRQLQPHVQLRTWPIFHFGQSVIYDQNIRHDTKLGLFTLMVPLDNTSWKESKYGIVSGSYFPEFGLNTQIYGENLRIQSEYRKIRTRNSPYLDTFHAVQGITMGKCKTKSIQADVGMFPHSLAYSDIFSKYIHKHIQNPL